MRKWCSVSPHKAWVMSLAHYCGIPILMGITSLGISSDTVWLPSSVSQQQGHQSRDRLHGDHQCHDISTNQFHGHIKDTELQMTFHLPTSDTWGSMVEMPFQIHPTHKETCSLLWIQVFTLGSPIHLTAGRLQSKLKCLASRSEPVLFPLPLHPLSPYPSLSIWPIGRDDCLSAPSPSVRLGRFTLLASCSPQPDRREHSMAASWHNPYTKV